MNSVENRVHAAMSAAADLAAQEIRTAPPLHLPSEPAAVGRRRRAPRGWIRWTAPLAAAAAVVAVAVSLVLVRDDPNGLAVPSTPSTSVNPVGSTGPGGVPRYYVAITTDGNDIVVGDSVTGKTLAKLALPPHTTYFQSVAAADDDRTFAVSAVTFPNGSKMISSWFEVRLAPGTPQPARLIPLPIKPITANGSAAIIAYAGALSGSGRELAVTEATDSGGLAVKVFSVATGQLLHEWTTNDPSLSASPKSSTQGLNIGPSLTWIDGDRTLALETTSRAPLTDTVRELNVSGPSSGDLLADSKVVWSVRTDGHPRTLLASCAGSTLGAAHLISANGTTLGCMAVITTAQGYSLYFLTYPLTPGTTVAEKGTVDYEVTYPEQQGLGTPQVIWISPSGDALVAAWITNIVGHPGETSPKDRLYIGVLSHGKFTPFRFPTGFQRQVAISTMTW